MSTRSPMESTLVRYEDYKDGGPISISCKNCILRVDTKHHKAGQHVACATINWTDSTMSIFDNPDSTEPSEVVGIKLILDTK